MEAALRPLKAAFKLTVRILLLLFREYGSATRAQLAQLGELNPRLPNIKRLLSRRLAVLVNGARSQCRHLSAISLFARSCHSTTLESIRRA